MAKKVTTRTTKSKGSVKKKRTSQKRTESISPIFVHGLIWFAIFVFSALFIYIDTDAYIAKSIRQFFGGLNGITAFVIPAIFGGTLIYLVYFKSLKAFWGKFVLSLLSMFCLSSMIGIFTSYTVESAYHICGESMNGGGVIGEGVADVLTSVVGEIASFIILLILFVTFVCIITRTNILPYLETGIRKLVGMSEDVGEKVKEKHKENVRQRREEEGRVRTDSNGKAGKLSLDIPDEELPQSLSDRIKKRGKKDRTIDIVNEFSDDIESGKIITNNDVYDKPISDTEGEDIYSIRFDDLEDEREAEEEKVKEKNLTEEEKTTYSNEIKAAMTDDVVEYKFPTLNLLDESKQTSGDKRRELYTRAEQLIAVLDNFGVKAKPVQVTQGPTVTRYEIQPESGIKLSKIVGLADDIALNLAVSTVIIAPVPGKAATVGVEIPNNNVTPVTIREMLDSPEFKNAKSKLTVCLGKDIGGNVIVGDIAKWPHALIAGATGSGKSVCINTIVTSILYKADPNEVKLIMVDPKQVELGIYNGIPHLLIPVVTEAKKAAGALNWAVSEMMRRYDLFKNSGVRKLEMYNKLMEKTGGEKIPQLVIIIDELADLMMVAAKEVEDYICRLAQLARAAGIHLIIATQRPSVDVITGLIKANIPSRIAFFVSSQVDSRTIIDKAGAEKLLGMGDMLYFPAGARSTTRVQGAFVSDGEVERIVDYIKETSPSTHYSEDLEEHIERVSSGENGVTPDKEEDGDALLNDAIKLAVELGKISTSMIQRRLGVGYSRAGRIIDQMESRGIVSPPNGSKPRDVLISHADMMFGDIAEEDDFEE